MTVAECAELCQSLPECIAFDYDRNLPPYKNSRCWIHDDSSIVMKEQPAVDHYVKGPCKSEGGNDDDNLIPNLNHNYQIHSYMVMDHTCAI